MTECKEHNWAHVLIQNTQGQALNPVDRICTKCKLQQRLEWNDVK